MTKYSYTITNKSGQPQTIAMYQDLPNVNGHPVVWFSKYVGAGNQAEFSWDINWGLSWGTTDAPLRPGVTFRSSGYVQPVNPVPGVINGITVDYQTSPSNPSDGDFLQSALKDDSILNGELKIETTKAFSTGQSSLMSVAVYNGDNPIFVMQGKPNGNYVIDTHPVYYAAVTDIKESTVISANYISNPTEIEFDNGVFSIGCVLDDHLLITC